jgi:hypothetical protein
MKGFIEVPNAVSGYEHTNVLVNINAIASVYPGRTSGTALINLIRPETGVGTSISYERVLELIKDAQ